MPIQRLTQPYPFCLHINRLSLPVRLGVTAEEQHQLQTVYLTAKLYFPQLPEATLRDASDYLCYDGLCRRLLDVAQEKTYELIEFLVAELYRCLRPHLPDEARLHLSLHKPLPLSLVGYEVEGATVEYTDLYEGLA